jgi:DNA-binding transcriptional MocR family regulator
MADAKAPKWAVQDAVLKTRIPPSGKLVMLTLLAQHWQPETLDLGDHSPGIDLLAGQTGMNRKTVIDRIRELEAHGWLTVRRQNGRRSAYVLRAGRPYEHATGTAQATGGVHGTGTAQATGTSTAHATGPVPPTPPRKEKEEKKDIGDSPPAKPGEIDFDSLFEDDAGSAGGEAGIKRL